MLQRDDHGGCRRCGGVVSYLRQTASEGRKMPGDLELKVSVADYHRTRPLLTGDVALPGIKPTFYAALPGEACLRPVYEESDVAELSLSWSVMAKERGEPVYALPIFPLRMF